MYIGFVFNTETWQVGFRLALSDVVK